MAVRALQAFIFSRHPTRLLPLNGKGNKQQPQQQQQQQGKQDDKVRWLDVAIRPSILWGMVVHVAHVIWMVVRVPDCSSLLLPTIIYVRVFLSCLGSPAALT